MATIDYRPPARFGALLKLRSLKTRVTIFTLAVFLIGIWSLALYASRMLREDMQGAMSEQQFSAVSIMAAHVNEELNDRVQAIETIAARMTPAMLGNAASMQGFLGAIVNLQSMFNGGVYITRTDGRAVADFPLSTGRIGMNYGDRDWVIDALKGKTTIGRPVTGRKLQSPVFSMATPIRDGTSQVIGVFVGVVDLTKPNFLDKITNSRYGKTGGYLIIAPQYRLIVTGTNKSRIMEPIPAPGINPLLDRYVRGFEGSGVIVDSRGLEVLSSAKQIPVAKWMIVARIPTSEAFAPIRAMMGRVLLATLLLTLVAGILTWWMLKRHLAPIFTTIKTLATWSDTDQPPKPLPIRRHDEIGELIGGFNRLLSTLRQREGALKESEERYQSLFEQAGDGIAILNTDGKILSVNKSSADMHGFTVEEMVGMGLEGLDVEGAASAHDRISRIMGGETLSFEVEHHHKDGHTLPLAVTANLVSSGSERLIIVIHRDLTERKRAEQEMAILAEIGQAVGATLEINEVYARVAAGINKLIHCDSLHINLRNAQQETLVCTYVFGLDIPGRRVGDSFPARGTIGEEAFLTKRGVIRQSDNPEDLVSAFPSLIVSVRAGMLSVMTVPLIYRDEVMGNLIMRSHKPNAYSKENLQMAEKIGIQIAGAIANALLFNDLNKSEKLLREREEKYWNLFNNAEVGMFRTMIDGAGILEINEKMLKIISRTREEMQGHFAMPWADLQEREEMVRRLRAEGRVTDFECRMLNKSGEVRYCLTSLRAYPLQGILEGSIIDITEQKRLEKEREVLAERLLRAEKMEALGTLAGGVAHDLNNVLGIVVGYAEMLLDEVDPSSPLRADVLKIMEGGHRSAAIVQDLLTLARRGVQNRKIINLNATVMDCQKTPEFEKVLSLNPAVRIKTDLEADLLNIVGSPVHLGKSIFNLVSNAIEAMPDGGDLTLRTRNQYLDKPIQGYDNVCEGDYVVLTVSDTGEGISQRDIKHIFEPFYTKKIMGRSGTGLGLAVVWGTVKDHNGYIDVQSDVGQGTTITLYFPVTREEITREETVIPLSDYIGHDESILVIDDIKEQRELAAKMLGKLNYRVKTVSSGEEAVEYLRTAEADLIVLDMIMDPGMDGLDTYKAILEIHPSQKAIIVSGFSESERVKEAQNRGAGPYLKKPYILSRLGIVVRDELDRK